MTLSWSRASGSVVGRAHLRLGRGGQDGVATGAAAGVSAAVVTDGCSSGAESEVGARFFAHVLLRHLLGSAAAASAEHADPARAAAHLAAGVSGALARDLRVALDLVVPRAADDDARRAAAVERFLLFGFLAAVVTPAHAIVFGIGDGLVLRDDEVTTMDPGPDNAPPYAAYGLVDPRRAAAPEVHLAARASDVGLVAIATDGLADLPPADVVALAREPRLAENPSLLEKRLRVLAAKGAFRDDATVAVLRRRPA